MHAHADQVDPVSRIEARLDGVDRAGIGARAALPAAVDLVTTGHGGDLVLEILVVVGDDAGLDEGRPMPGDIDAFDDQLILGLEVLGPDQRFLVDGHGSVLSSIA